MESASRIRGKWRIGPKRTLVVLIVAAVAALWLIDSCRNLRAIRRIRSLNGLAITKHHITLPFAGIHIPFGPLDHIYFLGPKADDRSLQLLRDFPKLRILTLTNTRVTDEGLAELSRYPELTCLYIANIDHTKLIGPTGSSLNTAPLITGKGLERLKDLPRLQVVQLIGPQTTDEDLRAMAHLKHLVFVDLKDTRVTTAGIAELKKALPNCKISVR